jgi:hypothetical protein
MSFAVSRRINLVVAFSNSEGRCVDAEVIQDDAGTLLEMDVNGLQPKTVLVSAALFNASRDQFEGLLFLRSAVSKAASVQTSNGRACPVTGLIASFALPGPQRSKCRPVERV